MSYNYGISALNLEMTDRVPRTEYSAESHWALVKAVTGIDVSSHSDKSTQAKATQAFMKAWNYDFRWNVLIHNQVLAKKCTKMGHAVYASDGVDYIDDRGCPFEEPEDALSFDPVETYGLADLNEWTKNFNNDYANCCNFYSDAVNMTGVYVTCISGLIEMFGWDMLLCAAGTDPDGFGKLTNRYIEFIQSYFNALANSDAPVVMIHDDIVWTGGAFIHPDWYRKYVFPNYKKLFAPLIEAGKKIMFTSDGTYTEFIDDIADCGVSGFVMEPTTDMQYIADKYGKTHSFVGNADTRILLMGSKDDIYNEVKRCMDIGKKYPGFIMAVGNHIPSNTPIDNALWYNEFYEKLSKR